MARIIDASEIGGRRPYTRGKYPWDEWLDGQARLIEFGVDFDVKPTSLRTMLYVQAYARGLKVTTELHGPVGEESIKVRALVPAAAAQA